MTILAILAIPQKPKWLRGKASGTDAVPKPQAALTGGQK